VCLLVYELYYKKKKKAVLPVQLLELSLSALHLSNNFVDILAFVHHIYRRRSRGAEG